jgi:vancomycin permeability regulator SanA
VFGAALDRAGRPTAVLRDRVATAVRLYQAGRVNRLVMSGGVFPAHNYDEPQAMAAYAEELGVPSTAIVLDRGGRSTYETCYRAATVFGLKQAILVTQPFHLPRAIYLCDALGIQTRGVAAELGRYRRSTLLIWNLRELLANANALVQVHLTPRASAAALAPTELP